jgi:hypothetical protein
VISLLIATVLPVCMYDANLASGANVPVACYESAALCEAQTARYLYLSDELGSPVCRRIPA